MSYFQPNKAEYEIALTRQAKGYSGFWDWYLQRKRYDEVTIQVYRGNKACDKARADINKACDKAWADIKDKLDDLS